MAGQLAGLARARASGSLEINGSPGGTVYLAEGCLAFAESPEAPDLGARLVYSGRVPARQWDQVAAESGSGRNVADLLTGYGLISGADLRDLLQSIVFDALLALALPLAGTGFRARAAFVPGPPHWAGSVLCIDVGQAWAYAEQEATRAWPAWGGIKPGTRPVLRELDRPSAVVTRWEWGIACQATGDITVSELARRNGFSLHETAHWMGKLIKAGLCAPAPDPSLAAARPPGQLLPPSLDGEEEARPPDGGSPPLPRRVPGAMLPVAAETATARVFPPPEYPDAGVVQSPDLALLRQILHGLKSLR